MNLLIAKKEVRSFLFYPFLGLLFAFIFLQSVFPNLERMIFWGEPICFLLIFASFRLSCQIEIQKKIIFLVYIWVFLFPFLSCLLTFFLWKEESVLYYLVRHLVLFYYGFFFFAGYKWGDLLLDWIGKLCIPLFVFVLLKIIFIQGFSADIFLFGLLWLAALKKYNTKKFFIWGCGFLIIEQYFLGGSGTNKFIVYSIIMTPVIFLFLKFWSSLPVSFKRIFLILAFIVIGTILVVQAERWGNLFFQMNAVGRAMEDVSKNSVINGGSSHWGLLDDFFDLNAMWRLIFWVYLLLRFFQYPLGIGLGTPFFDPQFAYFLHLPMEPGDEYLVPAHNFFLTFLVRLGIPFLIFFAFLIFYFSRLIMSYLDLVNFEPLRASQSRVVFSSLFILSFVLILASFNAILESPISAWFVWYSFGLFVKLSGDYIAKNEKEESQQTSLTCLTNIPIP